MCNFTDASLSPLVSFINSRLNVLESTGHHFAYVDIHIYL